MLLEKLFENLALRVDAFATCGVSPGWRLTVPGLDWVVLHFVMEGDGALRDPMGTTHPFPCFSLAIVPTLLEHDLECGHEVSNSAKVGGGEPSNTPIPLYVAGSTRDMELMVACGRFRAVYGAGVDLFGKLRDVVIVDFSDSPKMRSTFEAVLEEQRNAGPAPGARDRRGSRPTRATALVGGTRRAGRNESLGFRQTVPRRLRPNPDGLRAGGPATKRRSLVGPT
jgi:hypothetical protein